MATKIQWADETWNPVVGCSKISPGCDNCYAEKMAKRLRCMGLPQYQNVVNDKGWTGKTDFVEGLGIDKILSWKEPRMIFVGSMCDLFHPSVEIGILTHIFDTIKQCPQHIFQILTKRPDQALEKMWGKHGGWRYFDERGFHPNIWLGVTAENQEMANKRIPIIVQIPAAVRFVSHEPLLDYIDMQGKMPDWGIIGCESGHNRRPCRTEWVYDLVKQYKAAGKPVFVKQLDIGGKVVKDIDLFPKDLQIRECPA